MRHVSQDEVFGDHSDVVCLQKALAQAPFPYPGWARPAVEVLPLPVPQFVLLRPGTLCTIVVDARSAGSGLFTLEAPFTASPEELLDRASLFLGNVFEAAQRQEGIQCFFNEVPWALPLKRQLANGDVFSCRPTLEGPGLPLLGPGGNRHTLRRREAPYFEVLRAVELGSQTLTLGFGDRVLEDVLAELVYRRHQLGPVPEGLCMQLCQVQPAPSQGRRELNDVYPLFSTLTLSSSGRSTTTVTLDSYNLAAALDAARARHILQQHVQMAAGQLDRVVCSRVQPQPDGKRLTVHCLTYSSSVRSPTILLDLRALGGALGAVVSKALLHLGQILTGIQCYVNGVLRRRPTPVFNGDLVVFVPTGGRPLPTVATHTLWPLFQALNFKSAPCTVPRATLAEALARPTVGIVAWGRHLRERATAETDGGHSEFLLFTLAGVLKAAISDTPPTATQVASALGPVLAELLSSVPSGTVLSSSSDLMPLTSV